VNGMSNEVSENGLLTYEQLAPHLGLKRSAIESLVSRRAIPVIRINKRVVRFRLRDVEKALEKLTVRAL